jgi:hypothetical protein
VRLYAFGGVGLNVTAQLDADALAATSVQVPSVVVGTLDDPPVRVIVPLGAIPVGSVSVTVVVHDHLGGTSEQLRTAVVGVVALTATSPALPSELASPGKVASIR